MIRGLHPARCAGGWVWQVKSALAPRRRQPNVNNRYSYKVKYIDVVTLDGPGVLLSLPTTIPDRAEVSLFMIAQFSPFSL